MFRRLLRWVGGALFFAAGAGVVFVRLVGHDPARWHRDPATIELTGKPNEYLAAPPGSVEALAHAETRVYPVSPRELLARFDAIVRAQPRAEKIAGSLDELMITYVQRSALVGFPDYITVRAIERPGGAGLIIFSRSRFGHGDFGVNQTRVDDWIAELDRQR